MSAERRVEFERALALFAQGDKEEAIAAMRVLIGRHPAYADAYEMMGMMLYKHGRLDEAIEWTERLCVIDPSSAMAHANLSVFYMRKGFKEKTEEEKAKAAVLRFSAAPPKSPR